MSTQALAAEEDQLQADYQRFDFELRARHLMVADIIALVCVPAGLSLDYLVYPEHLKQFFFIRIGVVVALLAIVVTLHQTRKAGNLFVVKTLGVLSTLVINLAFCLMVFVAEGPKSPYYAGINLILTGMAVLLPWTVKETGLVCAVSFLAYVAACIAHSGFVAAVTSSLFFNNCFFIVITSVICVTATYYLSRARFEDFRLRHQLDDQNRKLQDLDRLKTRFFSNVSHELRTPLTLILGPAESILGRSEEFTRSTHENLLLIHRNSLRLLKLINDLLDLTRLDQGSEMLRKRRIEAEPFLKGIVDSVRHLGLSKQLRLKADGSALDIYADPSRLEKVVVNLLTNAIKYTNNGGQIWVRWHRSESAALIEVEDTGVGIPKEDLSRVFDRFHQVRSNLTNQNQGVGIGLALVKELVEEHGGSIEVESALGKGTCFRISLPTVAEAEAADLPIEDTAPPADEPFQHAFRSADRVWKNNDQMDGGDLPIVGQGEDSILVADDENDMRQFIVSLLSEKYRVIQTQNGSNVIDLLRANAPSVVLLDWMMPGKDGLALCREIRALPEYRDLKIVLVTARIDEKSKLDALEAGADDFLTKPFSSVELMTRASNLMRAAHLQRDIRQRNVELTNTLTKLKQTEARLIQSEKMNAIESMSAGLLHEVNNPLNYTLTAIGIALQLKDSLSPDMREIVQDVHDGMVRIRDVITHLKSFAYPEKPGTESAFPLVEAFQSACKIMAKDLGDIRIESDLPESLVVHGQKTQLTHLFMNLLGNAAKALREMGSRQVVKEITVLGRLVNGTIVVEVRDNGPGIPSDVIGRIFEPFFTTGDVGSGMGIGLSICHTIIESHSGTIDVTNAESGGAVFTITLPLAERYALLS